MSVQTLDALLFPLTGMRLIEASAGTGKTYTIANLYLRLLLGLGQDRPLAVDRILVVTFTTAATEELRDRVRQRIVVARDDFLAGASSDGFIAGLIAAQADATAACALLDAAQRQMDEAAIYTIHGFCHRALADNAFESGLGFELQMVIDETLLRQQAVEDFWRQQVATLDPDAASLLPAAWSSPEALLKEIAPFLGSQQLHFEPQTSFSGADVAALRGDVERFKRLWLDGGVAQILQQSGFKKRAKPGDPLRIEAMQQFCQSPALQFRSAKGESWELWTPGSITAALLKGKEAPQHLVFELCQQLCASFDRLQQNLRLYLLRSGIATVGETMASSKQDTGQMSPDDLLTSLSRALDRPANGQRLAQLLAQRYPVVMVDEFQDTDSVQYHIFAAIYAQRSDCGWIMIGDPKQAIYKFRGADVFTYINARRQVAQQPNGLFTLDTNWRSSTQMVAAINGLFQYAEQQNPVRGAFLYPGDIPFYPVLASPQADQRKMLLRDHAPVPLSFFYCRGEDAKGQLSSARARQLLAQKTAMELVALLNAATDGELTIAGRPLAPGNIAVLVRDRNEAAAVKDALAERGVNSVFLSRESVFDAPVAADLYHLLQAVMHPGDERKLRSALATPLLGASLQQIAALEDDAAALQALHDEFSDYNEQLSRHGVLSMLRQVMARRDLPAALLSHHDGQRSLTDLRHLGELLQQASETTGGLHDLLRWYLRHLQGLRRQDSDSARIRLESDSKLVQIVTIHASKGLEFDTVFVPLASVARTSAQCIFHRDDDEGDGFVTVADLAMSEDSIAATEQERLAEDMRLLYVALTRARYKCYVGLANIKKTRPVLPFGDSGIAHMLGLSGSDLDEEQLIAGLRAVAGKLGEELLELKVFSADEVLSREPVRWPQMAVPALQLPEMPRLRRDDWYLTSYTALARGKATAVVLGGASDEAEQFAEPGADSEQRDAFSFPRGARYGTLIHNILEQVALDCNVQELATVAQRQLETFGLDTADWTAVLSDWLHRVLARPLAPNLALSLNQLAAGDRISEMEFNFSLDNTVSAAALDRLLRQQGYLEHSAALVFGDVSGIMRGFIDLVFEYQGRFYLLDYKSNYLGADAASYDQAAMARAISGHRYDLQFLIYSTALHRYLAGRIADYSYQRHFGGVYYLFLRGMAVGDGDEGVFFHRPRQATIEAVDNFFSAVVA